MIRSVVIVEPDRNLAMTLAGLAQKAGASVVTRSSFEEARKEIAQRVPSVLFANVRLGMMRGTHLAHAATLGNSRLRAIVYGRPADLVLEMGARRPRMFFEREAFLPFSLAHYLAADLPASDRRDVRHVDRRTTFRGGRRATDIAPLHQAQPAHS
jgi:DNA-binding NtrC family response regulator